MNASTVRRFTDAEMAVVRSVDLPELLRSLGYEVKQVGSYHTTKEMDSLRIRNRRTWFRYSENVGGDAITFLQHFCGKSFPEAMEYLLQFQGHARDLPIITVQTPKKEKVPFVLPPAHSDQRRVFAYLYKRGIAPQVIRGFIQAGLLYEDEKYHNCVFVGRDEKGAPRFASKRGTCDLGGKPFKGDVTGSDKNIAFRLPCDPANPYVLVFEAPIDLMSFCTLRREVTCNAVVPVFLIGWRGVELSTKALIVVWVVQMVLILLPAVRIWGLQSGEIESILANSAQAFRPTFGAPGLMLGVLVCVWCYVGFECPAYMGEELKGGNRAVRTAITASAMGIGVIYAVTCWLWTAGMTREAFDRVLDSGTLLVDYCKLLNYGAGGTLVSIAALVSCVGCFISFATAAPRCFFDMGRNGYLPKSFSAVNRYQSPHKALFFYSILWLAAALYGAYGNMSHLFTFMSLFASATYILVCAAHIKDRWSEPGVSSQAVNKLLPILSIAVLAYMIVSSDAASLIAAAVFLLACIAAAAVWRKARKA